MAVGLGEGAGVVDAGGLGGAVVGLLGDGLGVPGCVDDAEAAGAVQGGAGAVGLAEPCASGNHSATGSDVLDPDRDGSWLRFCWFGVVVTSSGELPNGFPTGGLVVVPSFEVVSWDSVGGAGGEVVVAVSRPPKGTNRSSPASASTVATRALILTTGGPPYRPIGPRTGWPSWSTQKAQPAGGLGQERSGVKFFGGRHRAFGGSGQPGGGLNCLNAKTFHPQAAWQPTHLSRPHNPAPPTD